MMKSGQHHANFVEQKPYEKLPFGQEEENLLVSSNVLCKNSDNTYVFRIVGAAVIGSKVIYILPKFESDMEQSAKTGVFYVQVIKRYLLSGSRRSTVSPTLDNVPLIMRTFEELNNFYNKFGVYRERRHVHITSSSRQTNWSKTIIKNQALFSNIPDQSTLLQSVLYTDPMITAHSSYEGEISHLFRTVLTLLSTFIAPIMRINHPFESRASIDAIVDAVNRVFNKAAYYRRILGAHISAEAGPRKRLLMVLYNFMSSDNDGLAKIFGKRIFVFGTQDFEFIWEDACLNVLGAQRSNSALAQPRASNSAIKINSQRTDGIIPPSNESNKVTIVDAKYYINRNEQSITLPVGDVMKQFGYAVSARATWPRHMIQNVIVFPDLIVSKEKIIFLGVVDLEKEGIKLKDFDPVILVKVKPSEVFEFYVKKSINAWLRKVLISGDVLTGSGTLVTRFVAHLNGAAAMLEISPKGGVTIKSGSVFKSGQSVYNKHLPRKKNFSLLNDWGKARFTIKYLFANQLVAKEGRDLWRLKADLECDSMELATLIISGLDDNVTTDVWVERDPYDPTSKHDVAMPLHSD